MLLATCGLVAGMAVLSRPHVNTERSAMSRLFSTVVAPACLNAPVAEAGARLLAFEKAFTGGEVEAVDALHDASLASVDAALACSPAAGDLWMAAARLKAIRDGLSDVVIGDLRLSCRVSPTIAFDAAGRLLLMAGQGDALPADLVPCMDRDRDIVARGRAT